MRGEDGNRDARRMRVGVAPRRREAEAMGWVGVPFGLPARVSSSMGEDGSAVCLSVGAEKGGAARRAA